MNLADFHFDLPENLIGQKAIDPRDSCKLLVVNRDNKTLRHHIFRDLLNIIDSNCVLVINDTKVFPARLLGSKNTGGKIEVLLLKQTAIDSYQAIARGKTKVGQHLNFGRGLSCEIISKDESGEILVKFNFAGLDLIAKIDELGQTPLPPYIHSQVMEKDLRNQYQTVYAREKGSAAAPTAGLHFTPELMAGLIANGVAIERVTLHVGLGTFKPVTDEQVSSKTLHAESFWLTSEVADRLNQAKKAGKKIIAVGTTTCRVLETQTNKEGIVEAGEGETNIFIQPGYQYKFVDGLITNFHLPETSLLMLVTALVSSPNSETPFKNFTDSLIGQAYIDAVTKEYKFFSFGDAMLII